MDICILSMQKVNNMGSLLQSYALKKMLEAMGHNVFFLDIKKIDADYELLGKYRMRFCKEQEKGGITGKLSKIDRHILNRLRIKQKIRNQNELFDSFRSNNLCIDKVKEEYDACIIGSDEVFNCLNAGYWGFSSQLFGNVPEAKKVITYAASCGATTYGNLPEPVSEKINQTLPNLSAISVRDENTKRFISEFGKYDVELNLDPVLLYAFDREIKEAKLPVMPQRYCVIYSYINRFHEKREIDAIMSFCNFHKFVPIVIGAPQFWCKNYIPCSPFECLKVFQNAEFVITDTFHGTIFSTKYSQRFAVIIRDSNRNKLEDLVDRIGVRDHVIQSLNELEEAYLAEKNADEISSTLEAERNNCKNYLKENLE